MITTITMLAVAARMPDWSPTIALIMVACNVLAIIFARATVKMPNVGPKIPIFSDVAGLSLPALLGATSFGHIVAAGVILGLSNMGTI